jgi:uracil phosphoribosyltransferase
MINNLSRVNSIINQFVTEIRDEEIQKDPLRFRTNLERIGEIFAYEISKMLDYEEVETITPLGIAQTRRLVAQPVIATILRAGLPLHTGMLRYFDRAENAFISAYRKHHKNNTFEIALEYIACPDVNGKTLILCDPMLASGSSIVLTCRAILARGIPSHLHIVTAIASVEGIDYVKRNMPITNYTLWCAAIDEELTAQAYIVPGLGDAGDLAFGSKL